MPAKSKAQQRYFGMLFSKAKSGDISGLSEQEKKKVKDMRIDKLKEFAQTKHTSLPNKVASCRVASMLQKVAGYGGVSSDSIVTLIKLGYESEQIHMENEFTGMQKNAAAAAVATPIVKAMGSKLAPKAFQLAKGSAGITKAITKMTPQLKTLATNAPKMGTTGSSWFSNIGKSLGSMGKSISNAGSSFGKSLGKWKTPLKWGTGGLVVGSAATGAVKSHEGAQPRQRYYG